jgi:hypothetical protein
LGEDELLGAEASVVHDADGRFTLVLSIRTRETQGTRTVRADDCASLLDVAAFAVALTINPELALDREPASAAKGANAVTQAESPKAPPSDGIVTDRSKQLVPVLPRRLLPTRGSVVSPSSSAVSPEYWLGVQIAADTSLLPRQSVGGAVSADVLLFDWFRAGVLGKLFARQQATLTTGRGGEFWRWALEGRACYQSRASVRVGLCPTFQFGVEHGKGVGVAQSLGAKSTIYGPGAALLGFFPMSRRVATSLGLETVFPLSRDVFRVRAGPVHEIPAFSLEFALAVQFRPG